PRPRLTFPHDPTNEQTSRRSLDQQLLLGPLSAAGNRRQMLSAPTYETTRGTLDEERVEQLERLGMVCSHYDVAWEEGLAAVRGWVAGHGHALAPLDATHQGYKAGTFLKNARAAARKATEIEQRRAEGLPVGSSAGALSEERREQLEEIAPSWCPAWPVEWQRCFHLTRLHLEQGGELPTKPGTVLVQSEDLGRWVRAQRLGWDKLTGVQQWMCENILGIHPATEHEKPKPRTSQADKWAANLAAARQFYQREGHLQVPRKHIETIVVRGEDGEDQEIRDLRLGHGSATSARAPRHSPPNASNNSPPSACAGPDRSVMGAFAVAGAVVQGERSRGIVVVTGAGGGELLKGRSGSLR
ncbi:helicase associated domain-containing protein, partial [Streptomyces afghaniensis]|uniref:helicase associated domain-containing protein n=1 Tax=Streptomyces afghaniensis TaxID=66865 RepID=UPI0037A32D2B